MHYIYGKCEKMLLNVVANENNVEEIHQNNSINTIDDYQNIVTRIRMKKNSIRTQLFEFQYRIENRQKIRDGIIQDMDHLNYIENLKDYSDQKIVTMKFNVPYDLMLRFHQSLEKKYGRNNNKMSREVLSLIEEFTGWFLWPQQHSTTSFLKYKNKEPRLDVLLKLKQIADSLRHTFYDGFCLQNDLKQVIKETINADPRTEENYFICIRTFIEKNTKSKLGYYSKCNLMGLHEVIEEKIRNKSEKQEELYQ